MQWFVRFCRIDRFMPAFISNFLSFCNSLDAEQLAMIMLCDNDDNCDLFEDEDNKLMSDEDILLVMLADCSRTSDPTHLQYP